MHLETLQVFCDLVETGSFSAAAAQNFITQSAVSQQVRSLEARFDRPLIERTKGNVQPTPAGQLLYQASKDITQRYRDLREQMQSFGSVVSGSVRLATVHSVGLYELSEPLKKFLKAYPQVTFIGHAQTWWSNISSAGEPADLYPIGKVTPGGLTDRLLADYPNLYGDLSAGSGLNAIRRDPEFSRGFLARHRHKLIWGSDCPCQDGSGGGWKQKMCIGRECLNQLWRLTESPIHFRALVWDNAFRAIPSL